MSAPRKTITTDMFAYGMEAGAPMTPDSATTAQQYSATAAQQYSATAAQQYSATAAQQYSATAAQLPHYAMVYPPDQYALYSYAAPMTPCHTYADWRSKQTSLQEQLDKFEATFAKQMKEVLAEQMALIKSVSSLQKTLASQQKSMASMASHQKSMASYQKSMASQQKSILALQKSMSSLENRFAELFIAPGTHGDKDDDVLAPPSSPVHMIATPSDLSDSTTYFV